MALLAPSRQSSPAALVSFAKGFVLWVAAGVNIGVLARLHLASPDPKKMAARRKDPESILNQFPSLSNSEWTYADVVGGLCLVIDRELQTVVFQIYNIDTNDIRFEYELYEDINYMQLNSRFHCFEMEDCVAGFHFSSEEVADKFFSKVNALKPRAPMDKKKKKKLFSRGSKNRRKKRGKKGDFVVGEPIGFEHKGNKNETLIYTQELMSLCIEHVGVDGTGNFDFSQITPEWKQIFKEAGIRKRDLKNPEIAAEIMTAIKKQQMTAQYQAQPEYENYTEEDLEQMYTPEVREEYEEYQQQLEDYQNEIEQFRREQEELDRWQRENAHLLEGVGSSSGAPVAPPRNTTGSGAPVAPPRTGRRTEKAPVAPPRRTREEMEQFQEPELNVGQANQFAEELASKELKPAGERKQPPKAPERKQVDESSNTFATELASATKRRYKESEEQKKALARLEQKNAAKVVDENEPVKMKKYDPKKLEALDKMSAPKLEKTVPKTAQEKLKRNIYERSVEEEGGVYQPIEEKEQAKKSPEVLQAEQEMEKAQSFAEKARLEAEKLQRERDEIMERLQKLQEKAKQQKQKIKLPPLPQKPKLPEPPKLPELPKQKLNIPLPPPPPEKPKFTLPPPPPQEKTKEPAKAPAPKKAPVPKPAAAPPPKPKPKKAPETKVVPPPQVRKPSVVPVIKPSEDESKPGVKPPGMGMPSDLMMGIMKGSQLKKTAEMPKPKPKTVKPPPNSLLEAINSGSALKKLRKTNVEKPPAKQRLSKLPNLKNMGGGKLEGQLMAKLAETIQNRRALVGESDGESDEDSDWSIDD